MTNRTAPVTTAWKMADPAGRGATCLVSERGVRWQLVVWNGDAIVLWESHATGEEASRRAGELSAVHVRNGWQPAEDASSTPGIDSGREYFQRACPDCRQQTAVVTYRRHGYVVLFCETCEHGWTDRERAAAGSHQPAALPHRDRRRAA